MVIVSLKYLHWVPPRSWVFSWNLSILSQVWCVQGWCCKSPLTSSTSLALKFPVCCLELAWWCHFLQGAEHQSWTPQGMQLLVWYCRRMGLLMWLWSEDILVPCCSWFSWEELDCDRSSSAGLTSTGRCSGESWWVCRNWAWWWTWLLCSGLLVGLWQDSLHSLPIRACHRKEKSKLIILKCIFCCGYIW